VPDPQKNLKNDIKQQSPIRGKSKTDRPSTRNPRSLPTKDTNAAIDAKPASSTKPPVVPEDFVAVRFADESRGWILGHQGTLYSTTDKGLSWSQRSASEAVVSAQLSERGEVVSRLLARPNDRLEIKGDEVSVIDGTTLFSVSGEQVRYLAMRQRVTANNYSDSKLTPGSGDGLIPESILVALASLQHLNPEWIEMMNSSSKYPNL
jgi:hypothetical protein